MTGGEAWEWVDFAREQIRAQGIEPTTITVHPSREREIAHVAGFVVKLDPECPRERMYMS